MNFNGEYRLENIHDGGYWGDPYEADIVRAIDGAVIGQAYGRSLRALKRNAQHEVKYILKQQALRRKIIDL